MGTVGGPGGADPPAGGVSRSRCVTRARRSFYDNRMETPLGRLGVWCILDALPPSDTLAAVQRMEQLGYSALWLPEAVGRDPFALLSYLGARTERIVYATGIANVYARDPMTMTAIRHTLGDLLPGRFVLGMGVSHKHLVSKLRGHEYEKPVAFMRKYLEAMDSALFLAHKPEQETPIVLAALRPAMMRLVADAVKAEGPVRGAHPYLVVPAHTRRAREQLGPDAWLCPEQMVLRETDATKARELARKILSIYIRLPNYQRNLRDDGFGDADFEDGGSDRLVDALVAWGDADAIARRLEEHYDAGADHVCIQPFHPEGAPGPDMTLLEQLAPSK